jgi:hypothetical protein
LEELTPLIAPDTISRWRDRLDEADVAPPARRALLLDGLEVETGRSLTEARQRNQLLSNLRLILAEAEAVGLTVDQSDADLETMPAAMLENRLAQTQVALGRTTPPRQLLRGVKPSLRGSRASDTR